MAEIKKLNAKTTAVLTLDCQKGILSVAPAAAAIFSTISEVLQAARQHHMLVMHVGLGFRPDYPEFAADHPMRLRLQQGNRFLIGSESAEFHEALDVKDDITIVKRRVSAFSGNELELVLRAQGITDLVLFGIATSGIVLSTLRQAFDLDFRCVVIKDCCYDGDEEVHRVLIEKVFARQATVVDAKTFIEQIL